MKFQIEQIALYPPDPDAAMKLLSDMGAEEWASDTVSAEGVVFGFDTKNVGHLHFNYDLLGNAKELEVLEYTRGANWMDVRPDSEPNRVSHLGMHCTEEELRKWVAFFAKRGIDIAQEVFTKEHTNPVIAGKRWYHYVIFDTFPVLGVDIKFIVRREQP